MWETLQLYEFSIKRKVSLDTVEEKLGFKEKDEKSMEYIHHE